MQKDKLNSPAKDIVINTLNFELILTVISIILSLIPIVGAVIALVLWIFNIVMLIMAFNAGNKGSVYNYPINFALIK